MTAADLVNELRLMPMDFDMVALFQPTAESPISVKYDCVELLWSERENKIAIVLERPIVMSR